MQRLGAVVLLAVLFSGTAQAATYWIDPTKSCATTNCGTGPSTACCSYARFTGFVGCPGACGCDQNGCANDIFGHATPDTINFVNSGTYFGDGANRPLCFGWPKGPTSQVDIKCTDATGTPITCVNSDGTASADCCQVSGVGVSMAASGSQFGLITMGGLPSGCGQPTTSTYVTAQGFKVTNIPTGVSDTAAIRVRNSSHTQFRDMYADCTTGPNSDCYIAGVNGSFNSLVKSVVTNCHNGTYGCAASALNNDVVFAGNWLGPNINGIQDGLPNNDAITIQNAQRGYILANVLKGPQRNCLDVGQTPGQGTIDFVMGWNDMYDCGDQRPIPACCHPTALIAPCDDNRRCDPNAAMVKLSGDDGGNWTDGLLLFHSAAHYTHAFPTSPRNGCMLNTEKLRNTDVWNFTCYGTIPAGYAGTGDLGNDYSASSIDVDDGPTNGNHDLPVFYSLFGSDVAVDCTNTAKTCHINVRSSLSTLLQTLKFVGNGFYFPTLSATDSLIDIRTADSGGEQYYNSDLTRHGGGTDFNGVGHNSGNISTNPHMLNPNNTTNATLNDLGLTAASTGYLDGGDTPCHATSGTSGNTITVTCDGTYPDPSHYFAAPARAWNVGTSDCYGRGVLKYYPGGASIGCFTIQIGGACGRREVVSISGQTITFDGASCSWANGAKVGWPYADNAPPIGALDFDAALPTPTATLTVAATPTLTATPGLTSTPPGITATPTPTISATPTPTLTPLTDVTPIVPFGTTRAGNHESGAKY